MRKAAATADLLAVLDRYEPHIRRRLLEIIEQIRTDRGLAELARLIEQGNVTQALDNIGPRIAQLGDDLMDAFVAAAKATEPAVQRDWDPTFAFNRTGERAINRLRESRMDLIREFTAQQIETTRGALVEGVTQHENPRAIARRFRDSIGLTESQLQRVDNYRRALMEDPAGALTRRLRDRRFDRSVQAAAEGRRPLTMDQIDRMTERYRQRWIKYRSEVIARTEALRAVHEGAEETLWQAIDMGAVDPRAITRIWLTAGDSRVRASHRAMSEQRRAIGEAFESGNGYRLAYPGDPDAPASETIQCRCTLRTSVLPPDDMPLQ